MFEFRCLVFTTSSVRQTGAALPRAGFFGEARCNESLGHSPNPSMNQPPNPAVERTGRYADPRVSSSAHLPLRPVAVVVLTFVAATVLILMESGVLRRLAVRSGLGFWMVLLSVAVASYAMLSWLLWPEAPAWRRRKLRQVAVAGILAVAIYVGAINAAFAIATLMFGA